MVGHPCIPHPFAALQVYCYTFSLDLHVLGAPPAFVLSQDQTLKKVCIQIGPEGHLFNTPYLAHYSLYSVVKEPCRVLHASRVLYYARSILSRHNLQNQIFFGSSSRRIRYDLLSSNGHQAGSKMCPTISMRMHGVKPLNTSVITGDNDHYPLASRCRVDHA